MFFKKLQVGKTYACHHGIHAGKMLIYIDKNKHEYGFLASPVMENVWVPIDKFDFAIKEGIIKYVERIPKAVRAVAITQFQSNKEIVY
jgi:hypothetical protein